MAVSSLVAAIRNIFATPEYADRIPSYVQSAITAGNFGDTTFPEDVENAVYDTLVDKIARQDIFAFKYRGFDATRYEKGFLAFGSFIEDDYIEVMKADEVNKYPIFSKQNDPTDGYAFNKYDPFKINYASVKPSYYGLKLFMQYHVTTTHELFKRAFISEAAAYDFVGMIRSVLPESGKLDKYLLFRNMLASDTLYPAASTVNCVVAGDHPTAEEAITIITQIQQYAEALKMNTTKYNKLGVLTNTDPSKLTLFIASGIYLELKNYQYSAFRPVEDLGVKVVPIDGFGTPAATSGQFATLLDDDGVKIYKWYADRFDNIYNPYGPGYWNTFYKFGDLYGYSMHKNIVRFVLTNGAT